jgi:sugar lactone lactonase YvrE
MDIPQYGPYSPYGEKQPSESRWALKALGAVAFLVTGAAIAAVLFLPAGEHGGEAEEVHAPILGVSHQVYPATLAAELPQPGGDTWLFPGAVVEAGGATFALDTGHNRILKLEGGSVTAAIGGELGPVLVDPMAMATDGERLYVANSMAAQVLVIGLDGRVEKTFDLTKVPGDTETPRPIGVAALSSGGIAVSDAANHRVLFLSSDGSVVSAMGTGMRAAGQDGFNVPGAMTTDSAGNVYVVDTLNGRIVKLSPEGAYISEFGKLGDTAGALARPKGVAVDGDGNVLVSDGLMASISVFAPDGTYLGMIGRREAEDAASGSIFQAPGGLWLTGDTLQVMDRIAGLITVRLAESPEQPIATSAE